MNRKKITASFFALLLLLVSCRKKEEPVRDPEPDFCRLFTTVSSDTNYIPHHKYNRWHYCMKDPGRADWDASVPWDSTIGNSLYFDRLFHTISSHVSSPYYPERWRIDSAGNYYRMTYWSEYKDTVLLIKPAATNGDTIFLNMKKHLYVILINKNETVENIPGCYHVIESQDGTDSHHYYKKGIGELYFGPFILSSAIIN